MYSINEDSDLEERARAKVAELTEYEHRHPRQGPDSEGRPYDPVRDVIVGWLAEPVLGVRAEIDETRTAMIKSRTWEGFAWANHRFVLSDDRGNALIVGFNEDAGKWFVDTSTPVRLPREWVEQFMADFDRGDRLTGFEDTREVHDKIVRTVGGALATIPSQNEVADYLVTLRTRMSSAQ